MYKTQNAMKNYRFSHYYVQDIDKQRLRRKRNAKWEQPNL